jgi:hypothetical protein
MASSMDTPVIQVYLEIGKQRVFASAVDWPGWARGRKTEEAAIEALLDYADRYAEVSALAGDPFMRADQVEIVERLRGSSGTDFGVLEAIPNADRRPVDETEAKRLTHLVVASWRYLDEVAATSPAELRKGPRGGGRDRDKMRQHVIGAEASYARSLGIKHREPAFDDETAVSALRNDIAEVLRQPSDGGPVAGKKWPARYAARRIAWHVLDHAWEMQDRGTPLPPTAS